MFSPTKLATGVIAASLLSFTGIASASAAGWDTSQTGNATFWSQMFGGTQQTAPAFNLAGWFYNCPMPGSNQVPNQVPASNQSANVSAVSSTTVHSSINATSGNTSTVNQMGGGGQSNQTADANNASMTTVDSTINATSQNETSVNQF